MNTRRVLQKWAAIADGHGFGIPRCDWCGIGNIPSSGQAWPQEDGHTDHDDCHKRRLEMKAERDEVFA